MSLGRLVVVWGTRPEAIKLGPVVHELRTLGVEPTLLCTGQHTDLLKGTPAETDLAGSGSLRLPSSGDVDQWLVAAHPVITKALQDLQPIVAVVVQGDTMSAFAAACAAGQLGIPVIHVEAGLRSHDPNDPWPEEYFRGQISRIADWHYAPTQTALANLVSEGIPSDRILVTGNTVVSALHRYAERHILVTLHRRETLPQVNQIAEALAATAQANPRLSFTWPCHPNVKQRLVTTFPPNFRLTDPLPYTDTIRLLRQSIGLLTDSGGLQEEAQTLNIPHAVLRNRSDRPESLRIGIRHPGSGKLFPPTPASIEPAIHWLNQDRSNPTFGSPQAASLIARHLSQIVDNRLAKCENGGKCAADISVLSASSFEGAMGGQAGLNSVSAAPTCGLHKPHYLTRSRLQNCDAWTYLTFLLIHTLRSRTSPEL